MKISNFCSKKRGGGVQFYKRYPFKQNFGKISKLCAKSEAGFNFTKEIPLNETSENLKGLLKKLRYGQFYKRNQFKRKSMKTADFGSKLPLEIRYF